MRACHAAAKLRAQGSYVHGNMDIHVLLGSFTEYASMGEAQYLGAVRTSSKGEYADRFAEVTSPKPSFEHRAT